jgi:hypothetical protein
MKLLNATNLDRKSGIRGPKKDGAKPHPMLSVPYSQAGRLKLRK